MEKKKTGTVYKVLSTASLVGLFLTVGILIIGIMNGAFSAGFILTLSILSIIFACCALSLVWVRNIERKRFMKTSIVFLALTGACMILWIACAIVIYLMVKGDATPGKLTFLQIGLTVTLQFAFANIIARNIIKYKKSKIAFQIIHYISCVAVDLYASLLAWTLTFTDKGVKFDGSVAKFLFSPGMLTIFIVACVYIAIANAVLNSYERKKAGRIGRKSLIGSLFDDPEFEEDLEKKEEKVEVVSTQEQKEEKTNSKERLLKLQQLYQDGIITEDEYNTKRHEILKEI